MKKITILILVIVSIAIGFGLFAAVAEYKSVKKHVVSFPDGSVLVIKSKNKVLADQMNEFLKNQIEALKAASK